MTSVVSKLLVFCGPSGSGKSTLIKKLLEDHPNFFGFSVSHTTRSPRQGEENGVHYHFVSKDQMKADIKSGNFIESAAFGGNIYGTSKAAVETVCKEGKVCILDIDVEGVKQVKKTNLHAWYIFIKPPSLRTLEKRLKLRNTETKESLALRLKVASQEIEYGESPGNSDIIVINDVFDVAYGNLKEFVTSKVLTGKCNGTQ